MIFKRYKVYYYYISQFTQNIFGNITKILIRVRMEFRAKRLQFIKVQKEK